MISNTEGRSSWPPFHRRHELAEGEELSDGRQAQEFEKVSRAERQVGRRLSTTTHKSLLERAQHVLHSNPAAVPLIVLVLSVAIFGVLVGGKFFTAFSLTLILQQVAIVGIVGAAQTLVILTAGIDLSVGAIMVLSLGGHGAVHLPLRHSGADLDPLRPCAAARCAASSTACSSPI